MTIWPVRRRCWPYAGRLGVEHRAQDAIYQLERHRDNAVAAIKSLLNALQLQILQQRQQAEDRYRGTLIPTVAK